MTDLEIIEEEFRRVFKISLKTVQQEAGNFVNEKTRISYYKMVLYFADAVIGPLERKGMAKSDAIVDVASGDGQMSLALALLGYTDITLWDMDQERLDCGIRTIALYCPGVVAKKIYGSATNMDKKFDVLISYQTIEHLSDEGNYSVAKKSCQIEFLDNINKNISKLVYFNAPNRTYPIDGHDTGLPFFHYLPISIKKKLIYGKLVKCSWSGICRPVSINFLGRHLRNFHLASHYYAFDSMVDYVSHYPAFDYMGYRIPKVDPNNLSTTKKIVKGVSGLLGKRMQYMLPVLSVIYKR